MGLFSKPDTHSVLVVDIASSSVGVGLSGIRERALPELVCTTRVPFSHRPDSDLSLIERAMLTALRDALGIAFREGTLLLSKKGYPSAVNHCVISFSSPWFASKMGGSEGDFAAEFGMRYGSRGEVFGSTSGLHSAAESRLLRKIEDEIIRTFGIKEGIGIENFTVAFSKVLAHGFHDIEPAYFVDMTGHATDVLSMHGGRYHGQYSMPVGAHKLRAGVSWNEFWKAIETGHAEEFRNGNVFLIADDYALARKRIQAALPQARIVPFDHENGFIDEMVTRAGKSPLTERLAILITYSNLFL